MFYNYLTKSKYTEAGFIIIYLSLLYSSFLLSLKELENQTFSCAFNSIVGVGRLGYWRSWPGTEQPQETSQDGGGFLDGLASTRLRYNCLRRKPL